MTANTSKVYASGRARRGWVSAAAVVAVVVMGGACNRGGRSGTDSAAVAGDAGPIEVDALNYEVTPDRYRRWVAAQRALDATPGLPDPPRLDPTRFGERDISRAVQYLESDARARAALARAGISARDYVLTSLAIDQALVVSASTTSGASRVSSGGRAAGTSGGAAARAGGTGGGAAAAPSVASRPGPAPAPAAPRARTRFRNLPPKNAELVERNREDIERMREGARFRIIKERVDTVYAEAPRAPAAAAAGEAATIPAGTVIALRADSRVCTSTNKPGDRVTATVATPVGAGSEASIPAGATASLTVVGATAGAAGRRDAAIQFSLNSITVEGRSYAAAGTGVASRFDRVRVGTASKDAQKVAGGAVVGAIAGQVIGRDTKSTVVGAAVGAAAGAAAAQATARYDACVPAGSPIQLTLGEALRLRV
jgi:hypothetical protein